MESFRLRFIILAFKGFFTFAVWRMVISIRLDEGYLFHMFIGFVTSSDSVQFLSNMVLSFSV